MPFQEIQNNFLDYTLLAVGISLCIFAYIFSWPHHDQQRLWAIVLGVFYTFWGIWHHSRSNSLHQSVVLEYVGLGFLATSVLMFALNY